MGQQGTCGARGGNAAVQKGSGNRRRRGGRCGNGGAGNQRYVAATRGSRWKKGVAKGGTMHKKERGVKPLANPKGR